MNEDTLVSALEKHTVQWGNIDKKTLLMKCGRYYVSNA